MVNRRMGRLTTEAMVLSGCVSMLFPAGFVAANEFLDYLFDAEVFGR